MSSTRQVTRMLADPSAETLSTNFASHWLRLQNLRDAHPDVYLFPDWDENLNRSMRRETELFFDNIVREDRSVRDLLRPTTPSSTSGWRPTTGSRM